jgi:hypothetical protein
MNADGGETPNLNIQAPEKPQAARLSENWRKNEGKIGGELTQKSSKGRESRGEPLLRS